MSTATKKKSDINPAPPSVPLFLVFLITLLALYKFTVWDPFFGPPAQQVPGAASAGSPAPTIAAAPSVPGVAPIPSVAPVVTAPGLPAVSTSQPTSQSVYPTDEELVRAGVIEAATEDLHLGIALLGGRITLWELRKHAAGVAKETARLNLVQHREGAPFPLGIYSGDLHDSRVLYTVVNSSEVPPNIPVQLSGVEKRSIQLRGTFPDGREILKTFWLAGTGYVIGFDVQLVPPATGATETPIETEWTKFVAKDSVSFQDSYGNSGYVWFDGHAATRETYQTVPLGEQLLGNNQWVSIADQYFTIALVTPGTVTPSRAIHEDEFFRARFAGSPTGFKQQIYGGPNSYQLLRDYGNGLELVVNFGRLKFLSAPLLALLNMFSNFFSNYGLAIVLLTIVVKMCLLPLTAASFKSMKAMQDIQPEVQRIRDTVKDKTQQQQQLMEMYKKKGVNPLGGCLPILVQLPIFLGLYTTLSLAVELRHAPFALWVHDLSAPEKLVIGGIGIPVMVILLTLSMLIQQWTTPSTMDPVQKKVMLAMPLVFGFMFMNFPAGLTLYWLVSNIISIGQTHALRTGHRSPVLVTAGVCLATFGLCFLLTKL